MAFLRVGAPSEQWVLSGRAVTLRPPQVTDYAQWAELRALSRQHLVPWEPMWPRDDLSRSAYRRRVRHYQREARDDLGYAFFLFEHDRDTLLGGLTLSSVRRGVTQSATLGYWLGQPYEGRGLMSDAVLTLMPFAFETLRLHRVEAAVQPLNERSQRVLDRAGFTREGLARSYLKINGVWQDHLLFAMVSTDWAVREARQA